MLTVSVCTRRPHELAAASILFSVCVVLFPWGCRPFSAVSTRRWKKLRAAGNDLDTQRLITRSLLPSFIQQSGSHSGNFCRNCSSFLPASSEASETAEPALHCQTVAHPSHTELTAKKSRFIAYAFHAETWSDAQALLAVLKEEEHPKARHWCYAWFGSTQQQRCSDDGEPSGTAGKPILAAIGHAGLIQTLCVVVRYFGGVKLGTGGLVRAYGGAARDVLTSVTTVKVVPQVSLGIRADVTLAGSIHSVVASVSGAVVKETTYESDGKHVAMKVACPVGIEIMLREKVRDVTRGDATVSLD